MDAVAANDHEARMLFDPSPEVDSLAEYTLAVASRIRDLPMPAETRSQLLPLATAAHGRTRAVIVQNRRERSCETDAAGALDGVARRIHQVPVKELRSRLTPLLSASARDGIAYVHLVRELADLLANPWVGREVLLSGALAHELGLEPSARLRELVEQMEATR